MSKAKKHWDIDKLKPGDKIVYICQHGVGENMPNEKRTKHCKKRIVLTTVNASTGQFIHSKLGRFDMRNQVWFCHKHR